MNHVTVHSLLKAGLQRQPMTNAASAPLPDHENARGLDYYNISKHTC
jgi:hypothetical protein